MSGGSSATQTGAIAHDARFLTMDMGSVRGKRINTSDTISIVSLE